MFSLAGTKAALQTLMVNALQIDACPLLIFSNIYQQRQQITYEDLI